jgi:asparaginyl-tRNA synthetase
MFDIEKALSLWQSDKMKRALYIQSGILDFSREFLKQKGFVEILPVIISPITDPLADFRIRGEIECYGFRYQLTKSMIFHKQISLYSLPQIFSFSPNVRIEASERGTSGKHLIEFVQLDLEVMEASREDLMAIGEELLVHILTRVKAGLDAELKFFGRDLKIPHLPFSRMTYSDAVEAYGLYYENRLSESIDEPLWLLDFPEENREFYDREYPERPGILKDMDLIYPEGYGEALSGGEREFEYDKITKRIKRKGIDLKAYDIYLQFARKGLFASAGFGIGIERLTRYICGIQQIAETRLFAKLPGILGL